MKRDGEPDAELDARVRAAMIDEAESVGDSGEFSNRVIDVARFDESRAGGARRWLFPLAAAAVAAVLIGGVPLGMHLVRSSNNAAAPQVTATPTDVESVPQDSPSVDSSPTESLAGTPTESASPTPSSSDTPGLTSPFRVDDLSWVGNDQGFALSQVLGCKTPPGMSCVFLARTTDGGASWSRVTPSDAQVVQGTATHIRFASPTVGYLWGDHLYLTSDGGQSWQLQPDSAYAKTYGPPDTYELSDGVAMRMTFAGGGFRLERAPIGTNDWSVISLPPVEAGRLKGIGASYFSELDRVGKRAAILLHRNTAGGSQYAYSSLYVSQDNGAHWRNLGEPCPQLKEREIDATSMSMADDGSITVLCRPRTIDPAPFVATSTDGGVTFKAAPQSLGGGTRAVSAASATTLLAWSDAIYRSTDSGKTWRRVLNDTSLLSAQTANNEPQFLAFESALVGRYVTVDRTIVYTTRDGGATWSAHQF